jgi:hypothetical protein
MVLVSDEVQVLVRFLFLVLAQSLVKVLVRILDLGGLT